MDNVISPEYKQMQQAFHEERADYGVSGAKHSEQIVQIAMMTDTWRSMLDYGCGKQTLQNAVPQFKIDGYDPGIPGMDSPPEPHDMVVCTDVLEHIEPELLDNVLDDLKRVTTKVGFLSIHTGPAQKVLPDGRNAHLIQEGLEWWLPKLWARFKIDMVQNHGVELIVGVSKKELDS